jgi:D-glycero-alpha-D-manno-heptose 1-phosphate guanylyltransferase
MEAIILAGGLGTRLRSAVPDLPKCMAPVNGKPFLYYVIHYLQAQGISTFILSLGYKSEVIIDYCKQTFSNVAIKYSIESEPLGTGGAIQLACELATGETVIATNGDTLFTVQLNQLLQFHQTHQSNCTLALKPMHHFDRYGVVELDTNGAISSFKEKQFYAQGLINGGFYVIEKAALKAAALPEKFSFEKDFLEKLYQQKIYGMPQDGYFIDIGIPEDFERAQIELNNLTDKF